MLRHLLLLLALVVIAWSLLRYLGGTVETPPEELDFGPDTIDLLVRQPDELFEQPGPVVPTPGVEWGAYGGPGWDRGKPEWVLEDGRPWVQANQPVAVLRLPASTPGDRLLELELWCVERAGATPPVVSVRLNGVPLGTHDLAEVPSRLDLLVPEDAWRLGENTLELEAPVRETTPGASGASKLGWDVLALASVSYGEERLVTCDTATQTATLAATTGMRYLVETRGEARLLIHARADGPGELSLRLGQVGARDGLPLPDDEEIPLRVESDVQRVFPLPAREPSNLTSIELTWQPIDSAHALRLDRARVLEAEPHPRPNVVLVSIDTLAARHMSVYGYERSTTPALEAFARDAVVFERCVANAPWTLPSYLSVLTGLYPLSHFVELQHAPGVALDNYDYWQVAESRWTLAEALRARGYQTAASLDTDWLSPRFHVDQGFDLYDLEAAAYPFDDPEKGIRFILWRFGPWLDEMRVPSAPFFAFIHTLDAHGPYWPETPFLGSFDADLPADLRMTAAGSAPQTFGALPTWMAYTSCPPELRADVARAWPIPSELALEEIIARYDETILKTDAYLAEMFAMLRSRGLYQDSVIVITGDHGESFAHGAYSHGVLWEDVVHVPLLIKLPGNELGGTRVDTSVQLVDLYPTLLELVGAGPPREYLHGRSLLELRSGDLAPRPTFSQGGHIDQAMIESEGWKLVEAHPGRGGGIAPLVTHPIVKSAERAWLEEHAPELAESDVLTESMTQELKDRPGFLEAFGELRQRIRGPYYSLFDLTRDPDERVDLAGREPERVERLKALLQQEIERARQAQADGRPERPALNLDPAALQRLKDLGYTGDEGG